MISEKIYLQLCKKYGLKMSVIKSICRSPFELVRDELDGEQRTVLIQRFGKFGIKPYMKFKRDQKNEKAKANNPGILEPDIPKQEDKETSTGETTDMPAL